MVVTKNTWKLNHFVAKQYPILSQEWEERAHGEDEKVGGSLQGECKENEEYTGGQIKKGSNGFWGTKTRQDKKDLKVMKTRYYQMISYDKHAATVKT